MSIVILRNMAGNSLGHLTQVLQDHGLTYEYWDAYDLEANEFQLSPEIKGFIILGGIMNVDETQQFPFLQRERNLIQSAISQELPIFGICLGAQMIARSLGAVVEKNPIKEVGWTPIELTPEGQVDPVMSALGRLTPQFQWHEDTFYLPEGAVLLASSAACPRQAYRIGENIYGVQFHPEVTQEIIMGWLNTSTSITTEQRRQIIAETEATYQQRCQISQKMFDQFCTLAF